ncbi:MAG: four helix bundle protein [Clostridia bacterium]|nr:four helix bundle protein [Clostridia bacterium]
MSNIIFNKSVEFLAQIALFNEAYSKSGLDETISKRLLEAASDMGTHINKSVYGDDKTAFNSHLQEALKASVECVYLLKTLSSMNLFPYDYVYLISMVQDIKNVLIASINANKNTSAAQSKWNKYNNANYSS